MRGNSAAASLKAMAIYHLATKPVGRASGRSAVAAAAYRSGTKLWSEREGTTHDFRPRGGVVHTEIVLPDGAADATGAVAAWAGDREALWNRAEAAERRSDARVAREWELALPHELDADQRLALVREFAGALSRRYGVAVDVAIHAPSGDGDIRNHHAHLLATTRRVGPDGFGPKAEIEWEETRLQASSLPGVRDQLREVRLAWEEIANTHLARAGHDARIDHRSHSARGLTLEPTDHVGVHATGIGRRGGQVARNRYEVEAAARNRVLLLSGGDDAIAVITGEKSVFDERDVRRTVRRYLGASDEVDGVVAGVMASRSLVRLTPGERDETGRVLALPRFTSRVMLNLERDMVAAAERLHSDRSDPVSSRRIEKTLRANSSLSDEQRDAVRHAVEPKRIAAVVGLAGAGKTTMLRVARGAWAGQGRRVVGAALAGKAAEGLGVAAGIESRTLASWERRWALGRERLARGDVMVLDEAGMVGSVQLKRVVDAVEEAGAKLVLVGDPAQLQPIAAGAAFRAIAERIGFVEMSEVRRQDADWQRTAAVDFARLRTNEALIAYRDRGGVQMVASRDRALAQAVTDYLADERLSPDKTRLLLAYRRADVAALNEEIREHHKRDGRLAGEARFKTLDGVRGFAPGDRVLFRETRDGFKNGWLGTVEKAGTDALTVRLDGGDSRRVTVEAKTYDAIDHGYATTIHKAQGATVDRAFVVASGLMDRHLAYVAMTRHREGATLYAGADEFRDFDQLSAGLSRAETKETTLDYAARRGLGDGHGTLDGPPLVEARMQVMFETVARFEQAEGETARDRVRHLPELRDRRALLLAAGTRIYREPELAVERLVAHVEASRRERPEDLADGIAARPERFGALKGRAGALVLGAARRDRREALEAVRELAVEARLYARADQNLWPRALGEERARRVAMMVEVPSLSARTRQVLEDAETAFVKSDAAYRGSVLRAFEGREGAEIAAFASAVERRFGDVLNAPPERLNERVAAPDRTKLEGARRLMIAAQRFAREPSLALDRAQARTRHISR